MWKMGKKLKYEEKWKRFKEKIKQEDMHAFLRRYQEFKEIEEGLINEKMEEFNNGKKD